MPRDLPGNGLVRPSTQALLSECAAAYEVMAPEYHAGRFGYRPGRYDLQETRTLIRDIVATLEAGRPAGWLALDVACGTGKIAVAASEAGGRVVALDAARGMLEQCAANCRRAAVADAVMLTNASAGSLPYRDGVFDIVFCSRFLHLFPNEAYPELVGEMARVLRPGGYLVIEMKNQWYGIGLHWAQGRLRAAGARPPSSCVDLRYLPALGRQVGGLRLLRSYGLLLPKGWWVMDRPRLARAVRALARGPLKPLSAHLVAVYRRD